MSNKERKMQEYLIHAADEMLTERGSTYLATTPITEINKIMHHELRMRDYPNTNTKANAEWLMWQDWLMGGAFIGSEIYIGYEFEETFSYLLKGMETCSTDVKRAHVSSELFRIFRLLLVAENHIYGK